MMPFFLNPVKPKKGRVRVKRQVEDVPVTFTQNTQEMVSSLKVSGTKAWAKMAPGSIKIVKRLRPQVSI